MSSYFLTWRTQDDMSDMSFPPWMIGHMQAMGIIEAPPDLADHQSMEALEDNLSRGSDTAPESTLKASSRSVRKRPASNNSAIAVDSEMKNNAPQQTASLDRWLRRVPFSSNEGAGQVNDDEDGDGQHGPEPGDGGRDADGHDVQGAVAGSDGKLFRSDIEAELLSFMVEHGYPGVKPNVECDGKLPKWGIVVREGEVAKLAPLPRPVFGTAKSLELVLTQEKLIQIENENYLQAAWSKKDQYQALRHPPTFCSIPSG